MRKTLHGVTAVALIISQAAAAIPTFAEDTGPVRDVFYCEQRKLGSWFYCDPDKEKDPTLLETPSAVPAVKQLAAIGEELDELKARAILNPTTENLAAYMHYQRAQLDRASTFADVWGRTVWQNPELDYTFERPINSLGKRTWMEDRKAAKASTMAQLSQRYGVFYFYSSACSACRVFGPIVRSLSDQYGLEVLAVSMDGGPNDQFPHYVVDTGQYRKMGLTGDQVPALVLFDTQTKRPIPIGYGLMAADEVMDRIFTLTQTEPGSDY
ncbi:conjugal transfer protein TraF [Novosphingobium album (ex Hu et al. 2023)]|uniref:Conjugal transfer protein TraF n=1 Tax=Novosphingobium album (ex Hu et al. 2023) TaxID=2930093 RepID=A0ABT0B4Z2_9SPHN|nr:conjugal transfer protein TraF [Novosphingobium album (ex Hu et al. 2023)]MCJ2180107.1 conjugal transfer protein TraF [Novosphingobium album (ex Hu et al. 2023)]